VVSGRTAGIPQDGIIQQEVEGYRQPVETRVRRRIPILLPENQGEAVLAHSVDARIVEDDGSAVSKERAGE
jgi:hypothetical protein